MALPRPLEVAVQELEQRGAAASVKIDEAAEVLLHSLDEADLDDPSVVDAIERLMRAAAAAAPTEPIAPTVRRRG